MYTDLSLNKIKKSCELLGSAASTVVMNRIPLYAIEVDDYKKSNQPPDAQWREFDGEVVGYDKRYWIKSSFETPELEEGTEIYLEIDTGVNGWDANNPQALLYIDGKMACGMDINHKRIRLEGGKAYDTVCYFFSGVERARMTVVYKLVKVFKSIEALYYDILMPYETCRDVYSPTCAEYSQVLGYLERAVNMLDLRAPVATSPEFMSGVERALSFMREEFYGKLCSKEGKPTVNCVGHTHIDVEWKWDRRQTREKIQRSASTAVDLMRDFPEYKFMLSQPELYRYLKEDAPEKYEEVKQLVKEGLWEPEGGLFLECDCNLISGESMVRQFLHGKRFFREEFGKESRVCFLPDVFGYSAAMPQIMKKSGIDCFITSKISWNDTNTMPYDTFIWQGIDGTEILASFITGQKYNKNASARGTTYVGDINPAFIKGTWERYKQKGYCNNVLNTYGYGDGGGGPTREMLERGRRLEYGLPGMPVARFTSLTEYVEAVEDQFLANAQSIRRLPRWCGELYLEFHRGTYTTAAKTKRGNRKGEYALARVEALSATDLYFGGSYPYDELHKNWRMLLHNQFHDILPGSSIKSVYDFAEADYEMIEEYSNKETASKLSSLAGKIRTDGGILIYNPTGFERGGEFVLEGKTYATEEKIPPFGYKVISDAKEDNHVSLTGNVLENEKLRITFDEAGRIVSLYDKSAMRQTVKEGCFMNEFLAFEDYPNLYDAWEMEEYTQTKTYKLDSAADISEVRDGARRGLRIVKRYMSSVIEQTVWLSDNSSRLVLEHNIDWRERHQMLKLSFPVAVNTNEATYEIQYGNLKRQTHRNTSWDSAKFEVCAHKWVDVSEYGYGVALLNDCKYGYSVEGSTVMVTCLKCPTDPNPESDFCKHTFTLSLYPHSENLFDAGVIERAYALNQPVVAMRVDKNDGELCDEFSLVSVKEKSVVIEGVKRAEDSLDTVVRLYESFGGSAVAHITVAEGFKSAYLSNLMEEEACELAIENGVITLPMHAFEIATLILKR